MNPMMAQQALMAAGYDDPLLMSMCDRVMADGFRMIQLLPAPDKDGAQRVILQAENATEEITMLVTCRRKPEKSLDNPNS